MKIAIVPLLLGTSMVHASWWNPASWFHATSSPKAGWIDADEDEEAEARALKSQQDLWKRYATAMVPVDPSLNSGALYPYSNFQLDNVDHHALNLKWIEMGPVAKSTVSAYSPGAGAGRVTAICPVSSGGMYIGLLNGGVWYTSTAGSTPSWTAKNEYIASTTISALAVDPVNSSIVYAGTGMGSQWIREGFGAGIQVSTNSGSKWSTPDYFKSPAVINTVSSWINQINCLATTVPSTGKSRVLAGFGSDAFPTGQGGGILVSDDFGATWRATTFGSTNYQKVNDIQAVPGTGGKTLLAISPTAGSKTAILRSTDYGATWALLGTISTVLRDPKLGLSAANPNRVVAVGNNDAGTALALFSSADQGASWSSLSTLSMPNHGGYMTSIWVDPLNASNVVVGNTILEQSTDGGATFTPISTYNGSIHADVRFIATAYGYSSSNRTIWVGTDGGLWKVTGLASPSTVAISFASNGINAILTQGMDVSAKGEVAIGAQDQGSWVYQAGNWTSVGGGDGGGCAFTPSQNGFWYEVNHSVASASTGSWVSAGAGWSAYVNGDVSTGEKLVTTSKGYVGVGGHACQTTACATNLAQIYDPSTGTSYSVPTGAYPAYYVDAHHDVHTGADWLFFGTPGGHVCRVPATTLSSSMSCTWVEPKSSNIIGGGAYDAGWVVSGIKFSPVVDETKTMYLSNQTSATPIWKSDNFGGSWRPVSGASSGSNGFWVTSLGVHPREPDMVLAGTKGGLVLSFDGGRHWGVFDQIDNKWIIGNQATANVEIRDMKFNGDTLYLGCYGRGVMKAKVPVYPRVF